MSDHVKGQSTLPLSMASTETGSGTSVLLCPLCDCPYDTGEHQAKLLPCHHSYCVACLEQLAVGRKLFRCPEQACRKKTQVPEDGIENLPTNFYVEQMQSLVVPSGGGAAESVAEGMVSQCQKHMNQPLLFYCSTCMVAICMNCTVIDHDKNAGHQISDIASVVKSNQNILHRKLEKAEKALENYQQNLNLLKTEMGNLEIAKSSALNQIGETFKQLHDKLNQRKELLSESIEQIYLERKQLIVRNAHHYKEGAAQLSKCKEEIVQGIETNDVNSAIALKKGVETIGKIDSMCEASERTFKYENNYVQFHFQHGLQEFIGALQGLGAVTCKKSLPSNIKSKMDVPKCIAGIPVTIAIHIKDANNQPLNEYPITATLAEDTLSQTISMRPTCQQGGLYSFDFRPKVCGRYKMTLLFADNPIWGSHKDFVVHPNNPVIKFGQEGSPNGKLFHPTSVAISSHGNIYVADMGNKRIQVFNDIGRPLAAFPVGGSESTTYDLSINHATEEIICTKVGPNDAGHTVGETIRIFSLKGEKKNQFSNHEMRRAMFVDVNSKGQIFVSDSVQNCIYIYSKEGIPVKKFGTSGTKPGQFNFPTAIAIGKDDAILVADTKNNRIQIFSKVGKFSHMIGPSLEGCNDRLQIQAPRGLTADGAYIFVADSLNRILVLKYNGTLVACIASEGDPISEPYNLAITGDDHVLVADFKNNCVKKFRYK